MLKMFNFEALAAKAKHKQHYWESIEFEQSKEISRANLKIKQLEEKIENLKRDFDTSQLALIKEKNDLQTTAQVCAIIYNNNHLIFFYCRQLAMK